ncbi:MAG: hypothetical protein PHW15_00005, partial [Patescibacteria group bacterium]|nr:hypothetical protein [Patescibacteria group bacterium]
MNNEFENKIFEDLTQEQMFSKAKKVIQREEIKPRDFKDLYGEDNVQIDEQYVERMERIFKQEEKPEQKKINQLATIFEAVIYEHGELSDWFGPDAYMIKSSRYDDIKNGVDSVIEFREDERAASHLALAVDVTFSSDTQNKFKRIKKEIDNGQLAKVKYFCSEHLSIRGELSHLPRVIIGAGAKTVNELGELWIEEKNKKLGNHHIQFQILEEILMQMKAFAKYAKTKKQNEIADTYEKTAKMIEKIYQNKKENLKD